MYKTTVYQTYLKKKKKKRKTVQKSNQLSVTDENHSSKKVGLPLQRQTLRLK